MLRRLLPDTLFGRQLLVLLFCLLLSQLVFVAVLLLPPGYDGLRHGGDSRMAMLAAVVLIVDMAPPEQRHALVASHRLEAAGVRLLPPGSAAASWPAVTGDAPNPDAAALARLLNGGATVLYSPEDQRSQSLAVRLQDGTVVEVARRGAPQPWLPIVNVLLLMLVLTMGGYLVTRQVTQPLSRLVEAADAIGADIRAAPVAEDGPIEVRQLAHALNVMRERLIRYLDSRTEMIAAMSHDLKTPATRMRLRAESLDDPALRERFVADLAEMDELVQSTLDLLRGQREMVARQSIDLRELLAEIAGDFREVGGLVTLTIPQHVHVPGHRLQIKRALANLIHNSIKYAGSADVLVDTTRDVARIVVLDRGPGVPASDLPHLFKPFYRVESSRNRMTGGTGLGLAIALDVVLLHRGTIKLANREGGGLEAEVQLPLG